MDARRCYGWRFRIYEQVIRLVPLYDAKMVCRRNTYVFMYTADGAVNDEDRQTRR